MTTSQSVRPPNRRLLRRLLLGGLVLVALFCALFCANGLWPASPELSTTPAAALTEAPAELRVVAWNIAKAEAFTSGRSFASSAAVRARLDRMAALVREQEPHLVILSEILRECAPCPVDQVQHLAAATGMHAWAFGANYRFGLPLLGVVAGNAVLSRFPLRGEQVLQLHGARPFWNPTNNRRLLLVSVQFGGDWLRVGSVRNDSFDLVNNLAQTRQILELPGGVPALLAGDFNAPPGSDSMRLLRQSGRFVAEWKGPATFPAAAPRECIDYILAPAGWELRDHRVVGTDLSDHCLVVSVFRRAV